MIDLTNAAVGVGGPNYAHVRKIGVLGLMPHGRVVWSVAAPQSWGLTSEPAA